MPYVDLDGRQVFYAENQVTATPRHSVILVHGAGHMLPLEKPQEFSSAVNNFLDTK